MNRWRANGVWALLVLALAGCDITGEYERRFTAKLQTSGQRAVFEQHLDVGEFDVKDAAGQPVGVKLRIPKVIDANKKELPATDPHAQPPFLKIPGLGYTFDRPLDDNGGQFASTYVYFAAVPKADQKPDQVQAQIAAAMAAAFPSAAWNDVQVKTPQGGMASYRVIRGDGQQDFNTGAAVQKLDGKFALFFVDAPNHYALIGFRAAKAQAEKYQWDAAVEAAMGTVVAAAAPAAAAPAGAAPPAGAAAPAGAAPTPAAP